MTTTFKVGFFVGSLATASINRKLAMALVRLAHPGFVMSEIPFRDLPRYSYDYDADYPPVARTFKQAIADVDAVLFVTPEYNRSIPGGLEKRDRLGEPAMGPECLNPQAIGGDRRLDRRNRHCGGAAKPAQRAQFLQLAADERA